MAKLSADDIKALRKTVFFGSLPKASLDALIRQSHVYDIEPNQDLFRQDDPATAVFAVLSGLIKLTAGQPDGREVLVQMFQTGDSFAEALAFGNESYPVTATGLVKSRVLAAPAAIVQRLGTAEPETFKAIVAATYRHLHALVRQIEELKGNSGLDRLARYIRAQVDTERGETELEIPFDKKVLASALGITPESLSRAFRHLGDHGIRTDGRKISVHDPKLLAQFLNRRSAR